MPDTTAKPPRGFVEDQTGETAPVFADDSHNGAGIDRTQESVNQTAVRIFREVIHGSELGSFRASLEPGHKGVFPEFDMKRRQRHGDKFAERLDSGPITSRCREACEAEFQNAPAVPTAGMLD